MKKIINSIIFLLLIIEATAQNSPSDTAFTGKVIVNKDERLDILAQKQLNFNTVNAKLSKGYRLLVISSQDREKVMNVRTKLLQQFPDEKIYMIFQAPFIKLKFGNFEDKQEAERFRDILAKMHLITTNIYIISEIVEIKTDKSKGKKED